jgi:hypothetical protein
MTKDEALKMAIEQIKHLIEIYIPSPEWSGTAIQEECYETINACKEALKQEASEQEPADVARVQYDGYSIEWRPGMPHLPVGTKLYTHPPEWKGLTKHEIIQADNATNDLHAFAYAINAKLKEKNHD